MVHQLAIAGWCIMILAGLCILPIGEARAKSPSHDTLIPVLGTTVEMHPTGQVVYLVLSFEKRSDEGGLAVLFKSTPGRFSLVTVGEKIPRPGPRGGLGWILGKIVAPLLHRLVPRGARPVKMRAPDDLGAAISKHMRELLAVAGKPVTFEGDPLESRFEQARRDARLGAER